jgi:hypothetical protein
LHRCFDTLNGFGHLSVQQTPEAREMCGGQHSAAQAWRQAVEVEQVHPQNAQRTDQSGGTQVVLYRRAREQ